MPKYGIGILFNLIPYCLKPGGTLQSYPGPPIIVYPAFRHNQRLSTDFWAVSLRHLWGAQVYVTQQSPITRSHHTREGTKTLDDQLLQ